MYVFSVATRILDLFDAGDNLIVCARPRNIQPDMNAA
jgi:hypothetical protein